MEARRLFVHLADVGSYSATARDLRVARTTVMRHIAALENEVGVSLVQLAGNTLVLTEAGHRLADEWRTAFRALDRVEEDVRASTGRLAGKLRIWMPALGTGVGIVRAMAAFSKEFPDIQVLLQQGRDPQGLKLGEFDVAMQLGHRDNPELLTQKMFDVRMLLVASRGYVDTWGLPKSVEDFSAHRSVQETDARGRIVPWTLPDGTRVRSPPVAIRANGIGFVLGFALGGAGIARVPDALALPAIEDGRLHHVVPAVSTSDVLSWVYLPDPSPTTRAFLDFMAARVRARGAEMPPSYAFASLEA